MPSAERLRSGVILDLGRNYPMEALGLTERQQEAESTAARKFDNSIAFQEWVLRNELALYPENYTASKYTQSLVGRISDPDEPIPMKASVYSGAPNAFCLPNGSVFVSDGMMVISDAEEEILFALRHERNHVRFVRTIHLGGGLDRPPRDFKNFLRLSSLVEFGTI